MHLPGTHAHLSALLKVAATSFKSKTEKPILEILTLLEGVDLHPKSLHKALYEKLRDDGAASRVSTKLSLAHVKATLSSPQRPSIHLSPGS